MWFRRDLRITDNAAFYHALTSSEQVIPVFIFDKDILDLLENKQDRRVDFIFQRIWAMREELSRLGAYLYVFYGRPPEVFERLHAQISFDGIYTNMDYEPSAIQRDLTMSGWAASKNIGFHSYKDQVVFDRKEVLKADGTPYTVFTPYSRRWKEKLNDFYLKAYPCEMYYEALCRIPLKDDNVLSIEDIGFCKTDLVYEDPLIDDDILRHYKENRNFPAVRGTSRLGIHLRFGTLSIRYLAAQALLYSETWLNELIWREFFMNILYHFPYSATQSFKPAYDLIAWRNDPEEFEVWCEGRTGYPIVDAGMRELNTTGWMHNRVRMIVASFLTKHLLIDWRWGEAYFASKLLDYDLSANVGGWQWASSSGCDAAPYFRIFNPSEQTKKFDPELRYIRKWVPEFDSLQYPLPIVDHKEARERALRVFKAALQG